MKIECIDVEVLKKDKERLDWLADRNQMIGYVTLPAECVKNHLTSLRSAIDAAMELDKEIRSKEKRNVL